MADLIIKPLLGAGNTVRIQDQAGGAILTSADSGATIGGGVTIPAAGITGVLPVGVTGGSGLTLHNTPQFMVKLTSSQAVNHDVATLVAFDNVVYETNSGSYVTASDRWVPAVVGKYVIGIGLHWMNGNNNLQQCIVSLKLNGSTTVGSVDFNHYTDAFGRRAYLEFVQIVDVTATSDYFEAYTQMYSASDSSGTWSVSGSSNVSSHMWGYRIGDDT